MVVLELVSGVVQDRRRTACDSSGDTPGHHGSAGLDECPYKRKDHEADPRTE
jgi:hypothetical protein